MLVPMDNARVKPEDPKNDTTEDVAAMKKARLESESDPASAPATTSADASDAPPPNDNAGPGDLPVEGEDKPDEEPVTAAALAAVEEIKKKEKLRKEKAKGG